MKTEIRTINKYAPELFLTDYNKLRIKNGVLFVSLGQDDWESRDGLSLNKVAGKVISIKQKQGKLYCEWVPLPTPHGEIAQRVLKKIKKGFYLRPVGTGTLKDGVVQDDYRLSYFAIEAEPAKWK